MVDPIQADLARRDLLPAQHVVDNGYTASRNLVSRQQRGVDLLGPVNPDSGWQARAGEGLDATGFHIDWHTQTVQCPGGQINSGWLDHHDRHGTPIIQVRFSPARCLACPLRAQCTHSATGGRTLTVRPEAQHRALQMARQRQTTEQFQTAYRSRAGVEGTISQAVQVSDLRHARYRGLPKTHLQHLATAAALNLRRGFAWLPHRPVCLALPLWPPNWSSPTAS